MKRFKLNTILLLGAIIFTGCGGGGGDSSSDTTPIANQAPTANAGTDKSILVDEVVTITGAGIDTDGTIVSYQWKNGSIVLADTATFDFSKSTTGMYTLTLTVTDDDSFIAIDSMDINVTAPPVANQAPIANAGADKSIEVDEVVTITGTGSDSDGIIVSYQWKNGSTVLADTASFDFNQTATGIYTLTLTVTDDDNYTATDSMDVNVTSAITTVGLFGKVTYDLVPVNSNSIGLDYGNIIQEAVKGVQVDAIDNTNHIIESTTTDTAGNYSFTILKNREVKIRISAKLFQSGSPSWDVKVVDNTNSDALYVMEGSLSSVGESDSTRNLNATSGWGGSSYTSSRVAAPFAMLDTVYSSMKKILSADASANFDALQVNWSVLNTTTSGDETLGQIGTSYYTNGNLYILGDEDLDTDEYDDHVIAHEWGHYYEDKFSRSDSIGGSHGSGDILDIRVAFGEGWGNAFSGMVFDDPVYFDTYDSQQATGFNFNVESGTFSNPGWHSEDSVQQILYNLYDSSNSGNDSLSLGFGPIHSVFTGTQKTTSAFTSIFTFIKALKDENSGLQTEIDAIVSDESIATITDIYGTGRINKVNSYPYYDLNVGSSVSVQTSTSDGIKNKLSNRQYVKFTIASDSTYTIRVAQTNGIDSDPDFYLYRSSPFGFVTSSDSTVAGVEENNVPLTAGSYLLDVADYNNVAAADLNVTVN